MQLERETMFVGEFASCVRLHHNRRMRLSLKAICLPTG